MDRSNPSAGRAGALADSRAAGAARSLSRLVPYLTRMQPLIRVSIATACLALPGLGLAAQTGTPSVFWIPERPVRGSLVQIVVRPATTMDAAARLTGTLAGQPLHFERDAMGAYRALGGIPITTGRTIPLTVEIGGLGDSGHHFLRIPVDSGMFGSERLRVDSRFATPPDSALQARINRESQSAVRVYRASHATPRLWSGAFLRPLPGRITSPYGQGRVFNGQVQSRHSGTDFDGRPGDSIQAVSRGIVALTGDFYYAGNVVYVDHGRGLVTVYMHMSEILVAEGDTVSPGQVIGRVGATGRVTGPHLHLQAKYGTVTVNPLGLFEIDPDVFPAISTP